MTKQPNFYRPTWVEINLEAIKKNFGQVKKLVGPGTKIMAAVKADAYGHGLIPVSRILAREKIDYLGVASIDEGKRLREARIKTPILVLGAILPPEIKGVLKYNLAQAISSWGLARKLDLLAEKEKKKIKVHLKVDTGMGRLGVWHEEALDLVKKISRLKHLNLEGIFTHFSCADEDRIFTHSQIYRFEKLFKEVEKAGIKIPYRHAANSIGLMEFKNSHFNMVRPGLMLYGLYPRTDIPAKLTLYPALALKAKVVFLKSTPPGRSISYGRTHTTQKDTLIATVCIGYGDGYPRHLSNKAQVIIRDKKAPIVGTICMDQTMVDVGHIPQVKVGDEAILIGQGQKEKISAEELAQKAGTINYEIVCGVTARVPRIYRG